MLEVWRFGRLLPTKDILGFSFFHDGFMGLNLQTSIRFCNPLKTLKTRLEVTPSNLQNDAGRCLP